MFITINRVTRFPLRILRIVFIFYRQMIQDLGYAKEINVKIAERCSMEEIANYLHMYLKLGKST